MHLDHDGAGVTAPSIRTASVSEPGPQSGALRSRSIAHTVGDHAPE